MSIVIMTFLAWSHVSITLKNVLIYVRATEIVLTDALVPISPYGVQMSLVKGTTKFLSVTASMKVKKFLYSARLVVLHLILFAIKAVQSYIPGT